MRLAIDDGSIECWGKGTDAGAIPDSMGDKLAPVVTAADLGLTTE